MLRVVFAAALAAGSIVPAAAAAPSLEESVLDQINYVRAHPGEYAEQLRRYRDYFQGNILYLPGDRNGIITNEGVAAVDEAIDFLEQQAPLPPLTLGQVLELAARDHADAQGPEGALGHISRDGANPGERVRRRGGGIYVGETISYGFGDADGVVRAFIVDDGVRNRGHRKAIFTTSYRYAGVGCGEHARYKVICVVDYAGTRDGSPQLANVRGSSVFTYRGSGGAVAIASAR